MRESSHDLDVLALARGHGGGKPVLPLDALFNGIAAYPTAPEYWWLYALLLSTMIPSLVNLGCHWFDVVLRLAGDPEVAWVSGGVDPLSGEPPDSRRHTDPPGSCRIGFANGVEAFASGGGTGLEFDLVGTRGRAVLARDGAELHYWRTDDPVVRRRAGYLRARP